MKYLIVFVALLLCGCEPPEASKFRTLTIMTDADGNRYAVKHHLGGTFTVEAIK
jgi:hypothetical protein